MSSCVLVLLKPLQGPKSSVFFGMLDLPYLEWKQKQSLINIERMHGVGVGVGVSKIHRDYGIAEKLSRGDGFEEPY